MKNENMKAEGMTAETGDVSAKPEKNGNGKKRKMSKQMALSISMVFVSLFVITIASYA